MHGSSFSRYGASLLAFGHLSGLYSARSGHGRSRRARPIVVPPAPEPAISKEEITYQSHPELWRALHPLFDGRQREAKQAKPEPQITQQEPVVAGPVPSWTWEV